MGNRESCHAQDKTAKHRTSGEATNRSVQTLQMSDECDLLSLKNDDGSRNNFSKTECVGAGQESSAWNQVQQS
jgi:hypothetical protein